MKKHLLSLLAAVCLGFTAQAQYYQLPHLNAGTNPGNINNDGEYPPGSGLPGGWTTLHSTAAATPVWTSTVNLPFTFMFNNTPVNSYKVSTSGVLTFTTTAASVPPTSNAPLPSASIPDNSIMIWGIQANSGDVIVHKTFGSAPNRQHWLQFNSFSESSIPSGWTYWSIVLEEGTNNIYIVDQKTSTGSSSTSPSLSLTAGIQINATTAFEVNGSPALNAMAGNDGTPVDNSYYEFIYGTQPAYDTQLDKLKVPVVTQQNKALTIEGEFSNKGTATINSLDVNYSVNNGTPVTATLTGYSVPTLGDSSFQHPIAWTPPTVGVYTLKVWTSNLNGNPDQVTANDTITKIVRVEVRPRLVLHEVFTSSTCPPCKPGNANLRNITEDNYGMSVDIKYQQNFPSPGNDPYFTSEALARRQYYNVNSIPRMEVDGGWDQNANNYSQALLDNFQNVPTSLDIDATYSISGNTITANATINPAANINSSNLRAHMVITEKVTYNNARTNGETEFHDVMKKMMPNASGTPVAAITAGTPVQLSQTYTFPVSNTVENFNNLQVVVFLQDNATKEVFQSAQSRLVAATGVVKAFEKNSFVVYPNPVADKAAVSFNLNKTQPVTLRVLNAVGQQVYAADKGNLEAGDHVVELDLNNQTNGIYFVQLLVGNEQLVQKVSLVK